MWRSELEFNNANDFINYLNKQNLKCINVVHLHHTYKPNHNDNKKQSTLQLHKNMKNYHVNNNGWSDIAQHITIGYDGKIITGRDINSTPASAKGYNGTKNLHPFMIEMIGNFDIGNDKLEGKQLESVLKICAFFYQNGINTEFHRQQLINGKQPKTCPGTGIDYNNFISMIKKEANKMDNKPSKWAEDSWRRAKNLGLFDGTRPKDSITREEAAIVALRIYDKIIQELNKR